MTFIMIFTTWANVLDGDEMKRIISIIIILILMLSFTSCLGDKLNPELTKRGLKSSTIQRIAITNNRYAGRYTIIDKKSIQDFTDTVVRATDATIDSKLDPDFIFEFYDDTHNVATFKYIASITDKDTGNLIDENGRMYKVSNSIEDEFMKRLMNKDSYKNVADYYITLIKLLIDKIKVKSGNVIAVDISKDYVVTRSITSMEQKSILGSIDGKGADIVFPSETKNYNYIIAISTDKYTDTTSDATITVTDSKKNVIKYEAFGTFEGNSWNYHITYK